MVSMPVFSHTFQPSAVGLRLWLRSLSYVLAAVICIIPSNAIGWIGIMFAFAVAASYLGFNLLAHLKKHFGDLQKIHGIVGLVLLSHAIFAVLLKLYFFKHITIKEENA